MQIGIGFPSKKTNLNPSAAFTSILKLSANLRKKASCDSTSQQNWRIIMNTYSSKFLIAMQAVFIALVILIVGPVHAQTVTKNPPASGPGGVPPLFTVTHDATLQGDGTTSAPLSIPASPAVSGSLTVAGDIQAKNVVSTTGTVNGALTVTGNIQANNIVDDSLTARSIRTHSLDGAAHGTGAIRATGSDDNNGISGMGGTGGAGVVAVGGEGETVSLGGVGAHGQGGPGVDGGVGV